MEVYEFNCHQQMQARVKRTHIFVDCSTGWRCIPHLLQTSTPTATCLLDEIPPALKRPQRSNRRRRHELVVLVHLGVVAGPLSRYRFLAFLEDIFPNFLNVFVIVYGIVFLFIVHIELIKWTTHEIDRVFIQHLRVRCMHGIATQ